MILNANLKQKFKVTLKRKIEVSLFYITILLISCFTKL